MDEMHHKLEACDVFQLQMSRVGARKQAAGRKTETYTEQTASSGGSRLN